MLDRSGISRWAGPVLRRLDIAAAAMNPFLLTVVIGLAAVNVSCYVALEFGRLHAGGRGLSQIAVPGPTFSQIAASGLPGN